MAERRADDGKPDSLTDVLSGVQPVWRVKPKQHGQSAVVDEEPEVDEEEEGTLPEEPQEDIVAEESAEHEPVETTPPADDVVLTEAQQAQLTAATRRMHEATQEAAAERRRAATLEAEKAQILADLEALRKTEHDRQAARDAEPPFDAKAHMKAAYKRAAAIELDPTAENYEAQLEVQQDIIAEAQADILARVIPQQPSLTEARIRELARTEAVEAATAQRTQQSEEAENLRVFNLLLAQAKESGLDVEAPTEDNLLGGRHYHDIVTVAQTPKLYVTEGAEQTVEDQITAIVTYVTKRHGTAATPNGQRQTTPASVRTAQARNAPMERTGMGRTAAQPQETEDVKPLTLDQALKDTMGRRRV